MPVQRKNKFYYLFLFFISKDVLGSSVALKIMEEAFFSEGTFLEETVGKKRLRATYQKIEREFSFVFSVGGQRKDLSKGLLVLDLEDVVLEDSGNYFFYKKTFLPKEEIERTIKKSLELGLSILLVSNEIHFSKNLMKYFTENFNLQENTFRKHFELIMGLDLYDEDLEEGVGEELFQFSSFMGLYLLSWLRGNKEKEGDFSLWLKTLGPIIFVSAKGYNIKSTCKDLTEKGLIEKKDFYLFNMRANLEVTVLEWIRARRWRKVQKLLDTLTL